MPSPATPDLFRREVLDARRNDFLGTIEIGPVRYGSAFAACAITCLIAMACFLVFARYTRHERVEGELVPSTGLLAVSSPLTGTITRCLVGEGEQVTQGQPIAEIGAQRDSVALGDTRALLNARLREQQVALDADLTEQHALAEQRRRGLQTRIAMLQEQLGLLDAQRTLKDQQVDNAAALLDRLRPLRAKGLLGAFEWDQRESAVLDARMQLKSIQLQRLEGERELARIRDELEQLPLVASSKINEIERERADVAQAIARNEADRALLVRAPRAGVIAGLTAAEGQTVNAGQRLASLIPANSSLQAELWLPSRAVGFVSAGDQVVLRYHAYPYQRFGSHSGRVVDVGGSALTPDELDRLRGQRSDEPMYRVKVALDAQTIDIKGRQMPLKTSMTLDADILMDRQRLFDWIVAPLRGAIGQAGKIDTSQGPA